jgi:hypothetical protein
VDRFKCFTTSLLKPSLQRRAGPTFRIFVGETFKVACGCAPVKVPREGASGNASGAFGQLLQRYPEIGRWLEREDCRAKSAARRVG